MGPHKLTAVAIWPWFFTNAIATYPQLFKALPFSQLSAGGHSQTHGAACKLQSASPISAIQKIMSKLFRFRIWKSSQLARAIREKKKKKKKRFWFPTTKDIQEQAAVPSIAMISVTTVSRSQRFTLKRFAGYDTKGRRRRPKTKVTHCCLQASYWDLQDPFC
jgi:hypothetical protein